MAIPPQTLTFRGYWRAINIDSIPNESGIFCVYSCTNHSPSNSVELHELLYIGESLRVRDRISLHELFGRWLIELNQNQELCFAFAPVGEESGEEIRKLMKSALIQEFKPKCIDSSQLPSQGNTVNFQTNGANWGVNTDIQESQPLMQYGS